MFGILVEKYQEPFLRKAAYILGSEADAEDAVQDTFLKIYKHGKRFSEREGAGFNAWAYKILVNTCYSYSVKRTIEALRAKKVGPSVIDTMGDLDNSLGNEQVSLVQSVLSRLPSNLSRLLSLYFFEGKNYEEIASSEHVSLSAVKSGLHRAKKKFKDIAVEIT